MNNEINQGIPASSNVRGAEYPRIHPDLRVTFRLEAPAAHTVQVQPGGDEQRAGRRAVRHAARRGRRVERDHPAGCPRFALLLAGDRRRSGQRPGQ